MQLASAQRDVLVKKKVQLPDSEADIELVLFEPEFGLENEVKIVRYLTVE